VENYRPDLQAAAVMDYWLIKEDHSLRNRGMEFVFKEPLFGKDVLSALDAFLTWQKKTKLQTSVRTGLHVHLDVREMSSDDITSFVMLYTSLEPLIYKWVGDNRETLYTVTGAATNSALLNAANNVSNLVTLTAVRPTSEGELMIALTPGHHIR
jgi:hypothetical protein